MVWGQCVVRIHRPRLLSSKTIDDIHSEIQRTTKLMEEAPADSFVQQAHFLKLKLMYNALERQEEKIHNPKKLADVFSEEELRRELLPGNYPRPTLQLPFVNRTKEVNALFDCWHQNKTIDKSYLPITSQMFGQGKTRFAEELSLGSPLLSKVNVNLKPERGEILRHIERSRYPVLVDLSLVPAVFLEKDSSLSSLLIRFVLFCILEQKGVSGVKKS
jgi:hypothetical protein